MPPIERLVFIIYISVYFFKQRIFCASDHYVSHFHWFVSNVQPTVGELGHYYIFSHTYEGQRPQLLTRITLAHPLPPFQDCNAVCKDVPHGPAFRADDMEERDRCGYCPAVCERGTQLLFCQCAAEPRLNTAPQVWTAGYCNTSSLW